MKGRKWICALLVLIMLASVLPMDANAIDLITEGAPVYLTMNCKYENTPLVGATFSLYRVATPDNQCALTPTGNFKALLEKFEALPGGGNINKLDQAQWAELNNYLADNLAGIDADYVGVTDQNGVCSKYTATDDPDAGPKAELPQGLYLIIGEPHTQDKVTYEQKPILIMLPNRPEGQETWDYSQEIVNKPGVAKTSLKVIKIWKDNDNAANVRPKTLEIYLLCDGKLYDTVTLPHNGEWEYVWEGLELGHKWTVQENTNGLAERFYECGDPCSDEKDSVYYVWYITNKFVPPKLPQTGQLWWPVPVMLSLGMLLLLVGMLRRRGEKHEA